MDRLAPVSSIMSFYFLFSIFYAVWCTGGPWPWRHCMCAPGGSGDLISRVLFRLQTGSLSSGGAQDRTRLDLKQ